jgi:hypothetical protein
MIRFGEHKNIDFAKFLPEWLYDEEYKDVIDVFQDTINELYGASVSLTKTNEVAISKEEFDVKQDKEALLWNWGANYDGVGDTNSNNNGDWPYDENNHPSQDELDFRVAGSDSEILYKNTSTASGAYALFPNRGYGPDNTENYTFSYSEPIGVQSVGDDYYTKDTLTYNNTGLYQSGLTTTIEVPMINQYYTSDENTTEEQAVGILEKIFKLLDLKDPNLIDFDYLGYFADHIGYDMKLNMFSFEDSTVTHEKFIKMVDAKELELGTTLTFEEREAIYNAIVGKLSTSVVAKNYSIDLELVERVKKEFVELQVRALIENLPYWYKIKGTDDSIKILLYSFGLVSEIHNYYTKNYSVKQKDWDTADVFYNNSSVKTDVNYVNRLTEDLSNIPDDWYPTPHFSVKFDYNNSWSSLAGADSVMRDMGRFGEMVDAISAAKPINNVFKGLSGIFRNYKLHEVNVSSNINIRKHEPALMVQDVHLSSNANMTYPLDSELVKTANRPEPNPKERLDNMVVTDKVKYDHISYMNYTTGLVAGDELLGDLYELNVDEDAFASYNNIKQAWKYDDLILYKDNVPTGVGRIDEDEYANLKDINTNLDSDYQSVYNNL